LENDRRINLSLCDFTGSFKPDFSGSQAAGGASNNDHLAKERD